MELEAEKNWWSTILTESTQTAKRPFIVQSFKYLGSSVQGKTMKPEVIHEKSADNKGVLTKAMIIKLFSSLISRYVLMRSLYFTFMHTRLMLTVKVHKKTPALKMKC